MKAAVFHGKLDIRIEDIDEPEPTENELLLQIACAGICGTDASEFGRGPRMFPIEHRNHVTGHCGPMVPGHEFAGHVVRMGDNVTGFAEGDLVTSGAGISCGSCNMCKAGRNNLCDTYSSVGLERNGALAELTTVPADACLNVQGRGMTPDVAALAQPMSIAVHAMRRGRPHADEHVVVLGAGAIGAFLIHAAFTHGAHVTAVDLSPERLETAQLLGAHEVIHASTDIPLSEQLMGTGLSPSLVYECTGIAPAVDAATRLVQRGGRVVIVGLQKAPVPVDFNALALQEKELIGTMAHVFGTDFGHATELLQQETDLWARVAPTVAPLDDLVESGLRPMVEGGPTPIKSLFDPRGHTVRPITTS